MTQQALLPSIDKLLGRENYNTWNFAVKTFLQHESLWDYVNPDAPRAKAKKKFTADGREEDDAEFLIEEAKKDLKAKSKIILLIHPGNYHHVQNCESAKDVWQALKSAFEDSGLLRKVGLIRTLISTKLQNCSTMEEYVNKIMTAAHKLRNIQSEVDDEWLGSFLLAGLTDRYTQMIMALESSGIRITADSIKTKLLQEEKPSSSAPRALYSSKKHRKPQSSNNRTAASSAGSSNVRCFNCNQYGHMSRDCPKKKQSQTPNASSQSAQCLPTSHHKGLIAAFSTFYDDPNDWFFDSASTFHMTMREDWLQNKHSAIVDRITTANNSFMEVKSTGQVTVQVVCENSVKQMPVTCTRFECQSIVHKSNCFHWLYRHF